MSYAVHHQFVIVGGGTAGITVAAQLTRGWFNRRDVVIIEPSDKHYYQPLWTLVGAGLAKMMSPLDQSLRMRPGDPKILDRRFSQVLYEETE